MAQQPQLVRLRLQIGDRIGTEITVAALAALKGQPNETWGYHHEGNLPSDVAHICDWTNVTEVGLPHCYKGTCPGHRAEDILSQSNFLGTGDTYTLSEFYEFLSPFNTDLPYVYDSFTQWPGCTAEGIDMV